MELLTSIASDGCCDLQDYKNPVASRTVSNHFHADDVFYALSTCKLSTGPHSFTSSGHCTCALISSGFNPRIRVNQFVHSVYPRTPLDCNFVTLSFNNAIPVAHCFLMDGLALDATRLFPPLRFYHDTANYLTLNCIRDNPARTLTSNGFSNSTNMTVELCVNFCNYHNKSLAGLENGKECRECTSRRRCLQSVL
jgi:hypothetical protein